MNEHWHTVYHALDEAAQLIAAEAPDAAVADEGKAYLARVLAAGLGGAVLGHIFARDGLSQALPCYGGPNPDYIMRFAPVDANGSYRLEGKLNGSERVGVGLYEYGPNGAPLITGYAAFDAGNCSADGSFAIDIGGATDASTGLVIQPGTRVMLVRVLHRDPSADAAGLSFSGTAPAPGLALATESTTGALSFVANSLARNVREYLKWTRAARDLANRLDVAPPELTETVQGDADTRYFLGGFDLAEGEWLEVTMPGDLPGYWSLHAYNYWYEHLQTPGSHDLSATRDPDGLIRIAVGPRLADSATNKIDTLGRRRGALICRIIGTMGVEPPTARLMRVSAE